MRPSNEFGFKIVDICLKYSTDTLKIYANECSTMKNQAERRKKWRESWEEEKNIFICKKLSFCYPFTCISAHPYINIYSIGEWIMFAICRILRQFESNKFMKLILVMCILYAKIAKVLVHFFSSLSAPFFYFFHLYACTYKKLLGTFHTRRRFDCRWYLFECWTRN